MQFSRTVAERTQSAN